MFNNTIGAYNLVYSLTLETSAQLLKNCMSLSDLQELTTIDISGYAVNNNSGSNSIPKRVVVDGYIFSSQNFDISHKIGGATETVSPPDRYPVPVYNFHEYVYISGTSPGQQATVRFLLSKI